MFIEISYGSTVILLTFKYYKSNLYLWNEGKYQNCGSSHQISSAKHSRVSIYILFQRERGHKYYGQENTADINGGNDKWRII